MNVRCHLRTSSKRICVICGRTSKSEDNHPCGRNHLATFTMPFCPAHHQEFHVMLRHSGVDLTYTDDRIERFRRAMAAIKVVEWMLLEGLKKIQSEVSHES